MDRVSGYGSDRSGQEDDSMLGGTIDRTFRGRPRAIWRQRFVTCTLKIKACDIHSGGGPGGYAFPIMCR